MSTLEHKLLNTTETVFTAEFHTLDGNGFEKAKKYADRFRGWFDGVNATDNTAAHAHVSNVASAIAIKQLGLRANFADCVPRQESLSSASRHHGCLDVRC
jgi:methylenetetrahydrofolate reductase (NADPH)